MIAGILRGMRRASISTKDGCSTATSSGSTPTSARYACAVPDNDGVLWPVCGPKVRTSAFDSLNKPLQSLGNPWRTSSPSPDICAATCAVLRTDEGIICAEGQSGMKPEAPDSIAVAFAVIYFFAFSAQKSHVKSQNHLNQTNNKRSKMEKSSTPTAMLKTIEKKQQSPRGTAPLRG